MRPEDVTKEQLETVIKECFNTKDILNKLEITYCINNHKYINFLIRHYKLNNSHFNHKREQKLKSITKEELQNLVNSSSSLRDIFKKLDMAVVSDNYANLKVKLENFGIKYDHIYNKSILQKKEKKISNEKMFTINSISTRRGAKGRIIKEKLKPYECEICKITKWLDKSLTLQLDHINGSTNDNRLENLRLLCPNCHSQTDTFGAKKKV